MRLIGMPGELVPEPVWAMAVIGVGLLAAPLRPASAQPDTGRLVLDTPSGISRAWAKLQYQSASQETLDPEAAIRTYQQFYEQQGFSNPAVAIRITAVIAQLYYQRLGNKDKAREIYQWGIEHYDRYDRGGMLRRQLASLGHKPTANPVIASMGNGFSLAPSSVAPGKGEEAVEPPGARSVKLRTPSMPSPKSVNAIAIRPNGRTESKVTLPEAVTDSSVLSQFSPLLVPLVAPSNPFGRDHAAPPPGRITAHPSSSMARGSAPIEVQSSNAKYARAPGRVSTATEPVSMTGRARGAMAPSARPVHQNKPSMANRQVPLPGSLSNAARYTTAPSTGAFLLEMPVVSGATPPAAVSPKMGPAGPVVPGLVHGSLSSSAATLRGLAAPVRSFTLSAQAPAGARPLLPPNGGARVPAAPALVRNATDPGSAVAGPPPTVRVATSLNVAVAPLTAVKVLALGARPALSGPVSTAWRASPMAASPQIPSLGAGVKIGEPSGPVVASIAPPNALRGLQLPASPNSLWLSPAATLVPGEVKARAHGLTGAGPGPDAVHAPFLASSLSPQFLGKSIRVEDPATRNTSVAPGAINTNSPAELPALATVRSGWSAPDPHRDVPVARTLDKVEFAALPSPDAAAPRVVRGSAMPAGSAPPASIAAAQLPLALPRGADQVSASNVHFSSQALPESVGRTATKFEAEAPAPAPARNASLTVPLLVQEIQRGTPSEDLWTSGQWTPEDIYYALAQRSAVGGFDEAQVRATLAGMLMRHSPELLEKPPLLQQPEAVRLAVADVYAGQKDARAIPIYHSIIGPVPANPSANNPSHAFSHLAKYYQATGNPRQGAEVLLGSLKYSSASAAGILTQIDAARLFREAGDNARADALYAKAQQSDFGWAVGVALYDQASIQLAAGHVEEARRLLKTPIKGNYSDQIQVALMAQLGYSYYMTGDFAEAARVGQIAVDQYAALQTPLKHEGLEDQATIARKVVEDSKRWLEEPLRCIPDVLRVDSEALGNGRETVTKTIVVRASRPVTLHIASSGVAVTGKVTSPWHQVPDVAVPHSLGQTKNAVECSLTVETSASPDFKAGREATLVITTSGYAGVNCTLRIAGSEK